MQRDVPNNYAHQAIDNQSGLMTSYPPSQQTLWGPSGLPSSNHQPWEVTCGSNYSANESAPIYPHDDADQLAYPSNELSSSCSDTTLYHSYLLSTLTGGSETKTRLHPAYSTSLTTESQPTCFQNGSMWSDPSSIRTRSEFVPSQNSSKWWSQKALRTIRNFAPYQSPTSAGVQPGTPGSLAAWVRSPLLNHRICPTSEQLPSWSDSKMAFAARPAEHCWNNRACTNYQKVPVHESFSHTVNQQSSNVGYHNLNPFQRINTKVYKKSIDHNMFETGQQREGMQALRRDRISAPQASTGKQFMKLGQEEALGNMHGTMASGDRLSTLNAGQDCSISASVLPTDAQSINSTTFQHHRMDCESTCRKQSISNMHSPKHSQSSRKRKSPDVLRFLAELTSRELKALIFAFDIMEKRKRTAARVNLLSHEMNVSQQNPAMVQPCQFTAQNASCEDITTMPQRSIDLMNGHVEILDSCPPTVLPSLQKDTGAEWKGDNLQISHVNLNTNPTNYSNFKDLSNTPSMRDHCAQCREMNSKRGFPTEGVQQALAPHVVNHQHCHSVTEQNGPSLQAPEEKNRVCHDDAGASYSHAHCGGLGAECNIQNYSDNCLNSSSESPKTSASVPFNPKYLGSSQQNDHSVQSLDARNANDIKQTDTPVLRTNASQHDEQSLKEIEALYDMLQTSYVNKMNGRAKRQKMEISSTTIQTFSSELGQTNTTSISAVQSPHDNHAPQTTDCQDNCCPSAGCSPFSSQNTTVTQQVAEFEQNECSPQVEWNVSNSSTPSHSRAQENQSAEISPSFEIFSNKKNAAPFAQSEDKTERSLIRLLLTNSIDHVSCAIFPTATRSHTTESAEIPKSSSSNEESRNLQSPDKIDVTSSPQSVAAEQITEGFLINECSATSKGFQKNLTLTLKSEELRKAQVATANKGAHLTNAGSNEQMSDVSVSPSEDFPEQHFVFPAASAKLSGGQSNLVARTVDNQCLARSDCKTSSGVSAEIHVENKSPPSDVYTTKDNEISNSSPEKVVEELESVPNSEGLSVKESDTLEFILRSLGIIPEDNGEQSAQILTSLSPGVTSTKQSVVVSSPVDPSCTELKQKPDITLPSFNTGTRSEKQRVVASFGPLSIVSKATRDCSNVASFSTGESQQIGKVNTAVTHLQDDKTTSAVSKLEPDGVNRSVSVYQPNLQVNGGQNPVVTVALTGAEDNLPLQTTEFPHAMAYLVSASVPVCVGGGQQVEENLANRLVGAEIARQQHPVAANAIQLEDEKLHDAASSKENSSSIRLINPSKLSGLVSSVSNTASALLVEPWLIKQGQDAQETVSPSSAEGGNQLNSRLSLPSSTSCMQLVRCTPLINTVANQCSVGLGGKYSVCSGISSPREVSEITVCSGINTSNLNVVRYKQYVADGFFDSRKDLSKQLNTVPQQESKNRTYEMPISVTQHSRESLMSSSEESFEKPVDSTQAVIASSTAGIEHLSSCGASSSIDGITSNSLHVMQDDLPSRVRRPKCTKPALGIHSFPQRSDREVNPAGLTVGQAPLADKSLIQTETLNGCTAVAVSKNADMDFPLGIRITFVFSLSEHWEHWKVINSQNLISNSLATTGQELLRSFGKVSSFSANQMERHPNEINGPLGAVMGAVSNLEASTWRDLVADLPHSQSIVPFTNEPSTPLADTITCSTVANHSETAFCPEVDLNKNAMGAKHVSETNALVSTNISELLSRNASCNDNPTEAKNTTSVQREASDLCRLNSKEMMTQNFFSKNKFHSATELEMTTESILRFWSPSGEGTETHHPNLKTEKGLNFEHGIEWIHSGLELYTVASAAELNKNMHKNAMHCVHFGFTATVDGRQLHREKSHPKRLYNRCSGAKVIVCEEYKPELVESTLSSLTDEDSMGNWTDTALSNALLEPYVPRVCLQNSSSQMTSQLETEVYGSKQVEAGKTEITVPAMKVNSRGNNPINRLDETELINHAKQYPEGSTQPFNGQESLNKCEMNMDFSSEIKIKVLEHQELNNVLSELSSVKPKDLVLRPESEVTDETSEFESPGAHYKTCRNCDNSHLDVTHEQMETSATEPSSDTLNFASLSLSRVRNNSMLM
ncbi:uncharacterized protein [Heterodontus francisci]|uniref:uncharacterized protein n=1 Tax=Heterodontus francisci TaxID=7792 RepID=UPI00355C39C3